MEMQFGPPAAELQLLIIIIVGEEGALNFLQTTWLQAWCSLVKRRKEVELKLQFSRGVMPKLINGVFYIHQSLHMFYLTPLKLMIVFFKDSSCSY